jgi:hypothetical protein
MSFTDQKPATAAPVDAREHYAMVSWWCALLTRMSTKLAQLVTQVHIRRCWLPKIYGVVGCCAFEVSLYSGTYSWAGLVVFWM